MKLRKRSRIEPESEQNPFLLVTLVFTALAAFQSSIVIMALRRDAKHNRLRGDMEYDLNLKTELELAQLNHKIEQIYEAMRTGAKIGEPPEATREEAGA